MGGFITQAQLIKSLAIGDWIQSLAPLPSQQVGGGIESSNGLITNWFPWQQPSIQELSKGYPAVTNVRKDTTALQA